MKTFSHFVFALFAIFLMSFGSAVYGDYIPGVKVGHPLPGETSPPEYCEQNPFFNAGYGGQCTSFCWGRAKEKKLNIDKLRRGNAQDWLTKAKYLGFRTGSEAQTNSIAVWKIIYGNSVSGHVAFVEEVIGDMVSINEANYDPFIKTNWGSGYNGNKGIAGTKEFSKDEMASRQFYEKGISELLGYIYLDPAPCVSTACSPPALQLPIFSATISGTTDNLTLTANIKISDTDVGESVNTYLAFYFQKTWFFNNGTEWVNKGSDWEFGNGASPIYFSGTLASQTIDVVKNANVSSLSGGQLYVGYGLNESDSKTNGEFYMIYTVPTTF